MSSRFENIQNSLQAHIMSSFYSGKTDKIEKLTDSSLGAIEKRIILDQILRDCVLRLAAENKQDLVTLELFVTYAVELSKKEICSSSIPVVLLSDIFDIFTLDQCEKLFTYVENGVMIWKEDMFFASCKNNLLRMCNDLLRRLSRSQNTVFRGRILLFLAKFFPFSERSGLNIVSEFNFDNAAEYIQDASQIDNFEENEDNKDDAKFKIDYNFYNKFLTLQDFMRSPNQCYNKIRWRIFVNSATDVLITFQNFKLDGDHYQEKTIQDHLSEAASSTFFAKYMTNPKLLELQLSDPDFRRSILIQFLIVLQYLNSPVKFKLGSYELKLEQQEWIKEQFEVVFNLLAETPANSTKFSQSVKHMLDREELWNNWKNAGCPEFKRHGNFEEKNVTKQNKTKKKSIDLLVKDAASLKKYYMGHPELTRLWNLNPSNLEACKAKERKFLPELNDYFEEAIMQMDPEAEIEPEYKKVNDPNFGWRALRLLTQRSSCLFLSTNTPITGLSDYLELNLKKIMQDRPQNANGGTKQEILNTEAEEVEELLKPQEKEVQEEIMEESIPDSQIQAHKELLDENP